MIMLYKENSLLVIITTSLHQGSIWYQIYPKSIYTNKSSGANDRFSIFINIININL